MDLTSLPLLGEAACLAAAVLWAGAVTLFRSVIERYGAQGINLAKCLIATFLQGLTVIALDGPAGLFAIPAAAFGWVALSGAVGLIVGDTALFAAVKSIGVHRTLLLQTLAPAFAALSAWALLAELPTGGQAGGVAVILAGIALVVAPRKGEPSEWTTAGIALGVVAAIGQGVGLVLAKIGLQDLPPLTASTHRLAVATVGLLVLLRIRGRLVRLAKLPRDPLATRRLLPATILGTYFAMFLFMVGAKLAVASVAAVLLGTSPVFSLLMEWAATRKRPSARALIGTLIAIAGVGLLSAGGRS